MCAQFKLNVGPAATAIFEADREGILGEYAKGVIKKAPKLSNGNIHHGPKNVFDPDHPLVRTPDFTRTPIVDLRLPFHVEQWIPTNVTVNADGSGGARMFGASGRDASGKKIFDYSPVKNKTKRAAFPCPCHGWSHFVHVKPQPTCQPQPTQANPSQHGHPHLYTLRCHVGVKYGAGVWVAFLPRVLC